MLSLLLAFAAEFFALASDAPQKLTQNSRRILRWYGPERVHT